MSHLVSMVVVNTAESAAIGISSQKSAVIWRWNGIGWTIKKVFHNGEGKMHEKLKMTLQRAKNSVHVEQHNGVSFCKTKFFFLLGFIWLIWPFKCVKLTILTLLCLCSDLVFCLFYCIKISILGSLDSAGNVNCLLFYWPLYISICPSRVIFKHWKSK